MRVGYDSRRYGHGNDDFRGHGQSRRPRLRRGGFRMAGRSTGAWTAATGASVVSRRGRRPTGPRATSSAPRSWEFCGITVSVSTASPDGWAASRPGWATTLSGSRTSAGARRPWPPAEPPKLVMSVSRLSGAAADRCGAAGARPVALPEPLAVTCRRRRPRSWWWMRRWRRCAPRLLAGRQAVGFKVRIDSIRWRCEGVRVDWAIHRGEGGGLGQLQHPARAAKGRWDTACLRRGWGAARRAEHRRDLHRRLRAAGRQRGAHRRQQARQRRDRVRPAATPVRRFLGRPTAPDTAHLPHHRRSGPLAAEFSAYRERRIHRRLLSHRRGCAHRRQQARRRPRRVRTSGTPKQQFLERTVASAAALVPRRRPSRTLAAEFSTIGDNDTIRADDGNDPTHPNPHRVHRRRGGRRLDMRIAHRRNRHLLGPEQPRAERRAGRTIRRRHRRRWPRVRATHQRHHHLLGLQRRRGGATRRTDNSPPSPQALHTRAGYAPTAPSRAGA